MTHPGNVVFHHVCKMGLEGIVSKRPDPEEAVSQLGVMPHSALMVGADRAPVWLLEVCVTHWRAVINVASPYRLRHLAMAPTALVCPGACLSEGTG
jgi:hypothetical protein